MTITYSDYELSVSRGTPVEAIHFHVNGVDYRYTSGDRDIEIDGETYEAIPMGRDAFSLSGSSSRSSLRISLPRDVAIAYVSGISSVTVYRGQFGSHFLVYWRGRIIAKEFRGSEVQIRCESIHSMAKRPGLRAKYQVLCRHVLYGDGCWLDDSDYKTTRTITSISGSAIGMNLSGFDSDWFVAGYLDASPHMRTIVRQAGNVLTLDRSIVGLEVGQSVDVYAGCNHNRTHCLNKFDNIFNFGGFSWIPNKNPFSGLGSSLL